MWQSLDHTSKYLFCKTELVFDSHDIVSVALPFKFKCHAFDLIFIEHKRHFHFWCSCYKDLLMWSTGSWSRFLKYPVCPRWNELTDHLLLLKIVYLFTAWVARTILCSRLLTAITHWYYIITFLRLAHMQAQHYARYASITDRKLLRT